MNSLKEVPLEESGLSANDLRLKRFLELKELIGNAEKELKQIREELEHAGTHSTRKFVCIVAEKSRTNPPRLDALIKVYGTAVRELCSETTYKTVSVKLKEGAE